MNLIKERIRTGLGFGRRHVLTRGAHNNPGMGVWCFRFARILTLLWFLNSPAHGWSQTILVGANPTGTNGLVLGRVDLTEAARLCGKLPWTPLILKGIDTTTGQSVPLQFVPEIDFNPTNHVVGMLIGCFPQPGKVELRLDFAPANEREAGNAWDGRINGPGYTAEHNLKRQGGLPWRITFSQGKVLDSFRWNNRVYHQKEKSFYLCDDREASMERVATGSLCTVIRLKGRFVEGGRHPDSKPGAVYDWCYFSDRPIVYVRALIQQATPFAWDEVHPLELNYPGTLMPQWAGGDPFAEGQFEATHKSLPQSVWGMVHDGTNGIGMFRCGQVLLYDGGNGTYLQAHGDSAWQKWSETQCEFTACLWIGSGAKPTAAFEEVVRREDLCEGWSVTVDSVRARIDAAAKQLAAGSLAQRQDTWWRVKGARQLEAQGKLDAAVQVADGQKPGTWVALQAGDLGLILDRSADGIRVQTLVDTSTDQALSAAKALPLFGLVLKETSSGTDVRLTADQGWQEVAVEKESPSSDSPTKGLRLEWMKPSDKRLGNLRVLATVTPEPGTSSLRWAFAVEDIPAPWTLWRVVFPQVAVADLGQNGVVFFPKAAGQVERRPWQRPVKFSGTYPSGWTTMQFMAAYDETRRTGLYLAAHDPYGSTKDLRVESRRADSAVVFAFDQPVPDMGKAGNRFELSGTAVWQLLRGDWFDAAVTYRDWARREARWYPRLGGQGREDTPTWMRELAVWALSGGAASNCVSEVQPFTDYFGTPVAVHWYNWHEIPFDNDYPHYFPTKPGFADGVRQLQNAGTFVMPYINGRLWDNRDRGTNDFEFTQVALPAVSKNERGEPFLESYGSKETDGSPVRLGVMCPATELWQKRVRDTVLRLMNEQGVKGVYIDQVAAAAPTLCSDASHGHPLGGGHWWNEGYWQMLKEIRRSMPRDCMLTTECNGEPFIRFFDGYLTWHWQYDGQVPAFAAVYGGAIQMFGRSYGGGPTRDLALRMRVGQQLVFGEQLGWLAPGVVNEKENAAFLRQAVQLRRSLKEYFYTGEMARPPKLTGKIPTVRADWRWGGVSWVTTDAVLTGAWYQPAAKRVVLMFVNVSTEPVTATVDFDAQPYGFSQAALRVQTLKPDGLGASFTSPNKIHRTELFPPNAAWAWELSSP